MPNAARLLIADDQQDVLEALRLLLSRENFTLTLVTSPTALVDQIRTAKWDAVLMDLNYARGTTSGDEGLQLLSQIRLAHDDLPIVVMTAWGDIDLAVRAMRAGAQSFVQKPWDTARSCKFSSAKWPPAAARASAAITTSANSTMRS